MVSNTGLLDWESSALTTRPWPSLYSKAKQSEKIHRNTFPQIKYKYSSSIIFLWEKKFVLLIHTKNGFAEFHHLKKKEYTKVKTKQIEQNFLKSVATCGFLETANEKKWENIHDKTKTWKHWYKTYELSSLVH